MKQKLRIVSVWLALGTVCLCSARAARAQSTNASPLQSGVNRLTALTPANTGCGYSPEAVPCAHPPAKRIPAVQRRIPTTIARPYLCP